MAPASPPSAGRLRPVKSSQERAAELPGVEFLDRRLRVGQRAAGNAQEVDRTVEVVPVRRAAHVEVGVVGQRGVCPEAGPAGVRLAVDVDP